MANEISPATPDKPKPTMHLDHKNFPEAKDHMPGDEGTMKVHYKVRSQRQEDNGDGETSYEIHKVEHDGKKAPKKSKNAAKMPMDELKEVIKSQSKGNEE